MGQVTKGWLFVTWFCYHLIAKPGNKTAAPDPDSCNLTHILSAQKFNIHSPSLVAINQWDEEPQFVGVTPCLLGYSEYGLRDYYKCNGFLIGCNALWYHAMGKNSHSFQKATDSLLHSLGHSHNGRSSVLCIETVEESTCQCHVTFSFSMSGSYWSAYKSTHKWCCVLNKISVSLKMTLWNEFHRKKKITISGSLYRHVWV